MANRLTKLDVARHHLGTAMDLFIRDRDPVSVQVSGMRRCGVEAAGPKRKLEGIEALVQQEAADRADEEKLAKRLMICSNCLPARSNDEATGRSTR
jgi:hypothetical protein